MSSQTSAYLREQLLDRRAKLANASLSVDSAQLVDLLGEVDQALERMELQTYGLCEACKEPIDVKQLMANPVGRFCLDCLDTEQRKELQRDLDAAAQVQSSLLPSRDLAFPGWDIDYHYKARGPVSGDYCDLIESNGTLHFFFGDVAGKGVAASLLMAQLHTLFRSLLKKESSLQQMMFEANSLFAASTLPHSYATLIVGRIEPDGRVEFCNAGHHPPALSKGGIVEALDTGNLPFGLFKNAGFEPVSLTLERDDTLFFYTDGLLEAENSEGKEYGRFRLEKTLQQAAGKSASESLRHSILDLNSFTRGNPLADDLTVMAMRKL